MSDFWDLRPFRHVFRVMNGLALLQCFLSSHGGFSQICDRFVHLFGCVAQGDRSSQGQVHAVDKAINLCMYSRHMDGLAIEVLLVKCKLSLWIQMFRCLDVQLFGCLDEDQLTTVLASSVRTTLHCCQCTETGLLDFIALNLTLNHCCQWSRLVKV